MMRNSDYCLPITSQHHGRFSPGPFESRDPFSKYHHSASMHNDLFGDTDSEDTPLSDVYFSDHGYPSARFETPLMRERDHFHGELRVPSNDSFDRFDAHPSYQVSQHAHQQFKCRQLPCRTFVSTGSCPYGDRCVFLHDPSIVSKPVYIKTKRKSKDDTSTDTFFWPTMSLNSVMGKVDGKNMPHISQPYIVPAPCSYVPQINSNNDYTVFSMWEHFLDFCKADALSIVTVPRKVPPLNAYNLMNPYTGKRRLSTFVRLSQSKHAF